MEQSEGFLVLNIGHTALHTHPTDGITHGIGGMFVTGNSQKIIKKLLKVKQKETVFSGRAWLYTCYVSLSK